MTKEEIIKALEPFPMDAQIAVAVDVRNNPIDPNSLNRHIVKGAVGVRRHGKTAIITTQNSTEL